MHGIPDGEVYVTPANTDAMVRLIRSYAAGARAGSGANEPPD